MRNLSNSTTANIKKAFGRLRYALFGTKARALSITGLVVLVAVATAINPLFGIFVATAIGVSCGIVLLFVHWIFSRAH